MTKLPVSVDYITSVKIDEPNAPAHHVLGSCQGFQDLGLKVRLVHPTTCSRKIPTFQGSRVQLPYPQLRGGHRIYVLMAAIWVLVTAILTRADVVYFRFGVSLLLARVLRFHSGCKVLEINGTEPFAHPKFNRYADAFDLFLFESDAIANLFAKKFPQHADKVGVHLTPGVDLNVFAPMNVSESRVALEIYLEDKVLVHASGFQPHHDFDTIETAFRAVLTQRPTALLILVGDGPRWFDINKKLADLVETGRVLMPGSVPSERLACYIGAADVCLGISHANVLAEGNLRSFKIYEYAAACRPIVEAMDPSQPIPDWAREAMWVASPESPQEVKQLILDILDNPGTAARKVEVGYEYVVLERSWKAVSQTTLRLIVDRRNEGI